MYHLPLPAVNADDVHPPFPRRSSCQLPPPPGTLPRIVDDKILRPPFLLMAVGGSMPLFAISLLPYLPSNFDPPHLLYFSLIFPERRLFFSERILPRACFCALFFFRMPCHFSRADYA